MEAGAERGGRMNRPRRDDTVLAYTVVICMAVVLAVLAFDALVR